MVKDLAMKYSWKEKYEHVFECYCALVNYAFNYIAEKYGKNELDEFLKASMSTEVLGRAVFSSLKKDVDAETFLRSYVPHHLMIGSNVRVKNVEPEAITVEIVKCGSKSMLIEKYGSDMTKYYCRHCEVIPVYEQMGWRSERKTTKCASKGGNIGCTVIFKKIKC